MSYLTKTQSHLYTNATCPLCRVTDEDWLHVYTCHTQRSRINDYVTTSIEHLFVSLADHVIDPKSFYEELTTLHIWTIPIARTQITRNFDLADFL
jgi:hypothetical protein